MRHRKNSKRLGRQRAHRKAVLRNQVKSLLAKEKVVTTLALAKESRRLAEKLITLGKRNTLAAQRQAFRVLSDRDLVKLLFAELAPRFINRQGGYTRIVHLGTRRGDNAELAVLELTELKQKDKKEKKQSKAKKEAVKKAEEKPTPKQIKIKPGEPKLEEVEKVEKAEKTDQPSKPEVKKEEKKPEKEKESKGFLGGLRKFLKKQERTE